VLWALWHLPLLWTGGATRPQEPVWPILVDNTAKSVLFTWVFLNTRGSLLLAILSHAANQYSLEMATRVAAWLAAAIFLIVAAFQAALVLGAPWGEYTQGGGTSGALASSGRLSAAVSCMLSIVMAGAILARAGEGPLQRLPARVVTVLAWVATVYTAVAVVLNMITRSTAERALWAPVSIVLLLLVATVMVTSRRT
jgi:hypothetical protein